MINVETHSHDTLTLLVKDMMVNYIGSDACADLWIVGDFIGISTHSKEVYDSAISGAHKGCVGIIANEWHNIENTPNRIHTHRIHAKSGISVYISLISDAPEGAPSR